MFPVDKLNDTGRTVLLDGSMGTRLMANGIHANKILESNITKPDLVYSIHKQYIEAGSDIILTNTFNLTQHAIDYLGYSIEEILSSAISCAQRAAEGNVYIALDISPSGYNPSVCKPYDKEKAYDLYSKIINAGKEGTDLIFIETISIIEDIETLCEAAKDNCELPIFASMTFTGKQNTWFGYPLDNWISRSNDLPIDAVGMNCSLTPTEMYPLAGKLVKGSNKPVFVKPNRGQPEKEDNKSVYKLSADQFAEDMLKFRDLGIHIMGGCCGTDHECISKMKILLNQN